MKGFFYMNIKERYKELTLNELSLDNFQDIVDLKNTCKLEMNQEYLYLCDMLIIDIYINENLFDDALAIALKCLNKIDNITFQRIYVSLLERVIYIFIQKKNFKSSYRYAFMKRNSIDVENVDEVNRWYLEMAYIYAELNQKDKALLNLKAILNNYPNDSLKALTLSNMTKLYIDQKQIKEAKKSLSDCITLVYHLNDDEGIMYCEYLNAKLHVLEKNFKLAKQSFQDIFKNIHTLTDDYLNIANEYISLLIEMDLYDEAYRISIKYLKSIEKTDDLYIKKDYYKNYLKIYILKNKSVRDDLRQLLKAIEVLEVEIVKNDEDLINETNEDDKNLEVASKLKEVITRIEKTINIINIALKNDNERDCLMEFSKHLEKAVKFDQTLYVIFAKSDFEILPEFFDNFNKVNTYNYKKKRLYEREYSFNNLSGTVVEMLISSAHEVMIDFTDSPIPVVDIISGKTYAENGVKSLIAIPLHYEKEMFGCAIYISDDTSLNNMDTMVNLKIASKLLEFKLISLFYQESLRSQKSILQVALGNLQEGMFYLDPLKRKMVLTEQLASFLNVTSRSLTKEEYLKAINEEDLTIRQNINKFIEAGEDYKIEYRLSIGEKEVLVCEKATPYISKDGVIKFYVGTITKLNNQVVIDNNLNSSILNEDQFNAVLDGISSKAHDIEYKCSFVKFKITNIKEFDLNIKDIINEYVYQVINDNLSDKTYLLNDNSFISILEVNDQRVIDKKVKTVLNTFDQGIIYEDLCLNFDVKASVVRFPRDTYNFEEIIEFTSLALEGSSRYQIFTDDIRKNYIKKKSVTTCVSEQLKRDNLELLYLQLENKNDLDCYEIKYNVTGLLPKESIYEFLNKGVLIPFEKLVLKTLIKEIKKTEDQKFYFHISCMTLDFLMKDNFFIKEDLYIYKKIVICIDDYSNHLDKIINYLYKFGLKVNINYRILKVINFGFLLNNNINGMFIDDPIDDRNKLLSVLNTLSFELLTNNYYSDYGNLIYRTDKLSTIKDLKVKAKV